MLPCACRGGLQQVGYAAADGAGVAMMTSTFTFNFFSIAPVVQAADPSLSETEIREAYDALIERDGLLPNPSPPLDKVETLIRDVIIKLADEQSVVA
jgi:hypothetical protein